MKFCFITFRSITPAQRGEGVLKRAGFACGVQRTPRWMEEQGCGYCIRISCEDVAAAVEHLRAAQISLRKVYLRKENSTMEVLEI